MVELWETMVGDGGERWLGVRSTKDPNWSWRYKSKVAPTHESLEYSPAGLRCQGGWVEKTDRVLMKAGIYRGIRSGKI